MAKNPENTEEQPNDVAEEIEPAEKPAKPKSKPPKGGGGKIPLALMLGGALGGVVMIIVSVIIGTVIANRLFPPLPPIIIERAEQPAEEHKEDGEGDEHKDDLKKPKLKPIPEDEEVDELNTLLEDSDWLTFNLGKVQSNVKGSMSMVCVIDLAVTYKPYYVEQLKNKGFLTEGGKDAHGNPTPGGADVKSDIYIKFQQNISSQMLKFITSRSAEELQNLQSNGEFPEVLKTYLKKPFQEMGLLVGKVDVTYFIISRI